MENERERGIYRVTLVGSFCNCILLAFKALAGIIGHSPAMIADAIHSLSDFVSDLFVLLFVKLSGRPQDDDHEYGHGKYETLGTTFVGLTLLVVGLFLMIDAGKRIWAFSQGETLTQPGFIALCAAFVSVVVKEALFWYTEYYGKKYNSETVIANAWHHRSDAFSSIATLVGIGGSIVLGDRWTVLDPIAAVLVSILIMKVSVDVMKQSFGDLLDKSLPKEDKDKILKVLNDFPEIENPHNLRTRHVGARHSIEFHIRVDGSMTVNESHTITQAIERRLREELGDDTITNIHVEPIKKQPN